MGNFFTKPALRNSDERHTEHRHVTWLELFYDLAFVVAIASVAHEMNNVISLKMGILTFVLLFIPVWWAWLGDAFYTNRYDPEDHGHEIMTLLQMFGVIGLAIFAHHGLDSGFTGFVLSFVFVRLILAILSFRTGYHIQRSRKLDYYIAKTILLSLMFWVAALFFDAPISYWLIGIGIVIDIGAPLFNARDQQKVAVNASHLSSRFGFFFIILLGEIFSSVVQSVHTVGPTIQELILGAQAIAISFCVWWVYFENDNGPKVITKFFSKEGIPKKSTLVSGYVWVYSHLPLSFGIIMLALGLQRLILIDSHATLDTNFLYMISLGLIASLLSIGIMQMTAITKEHSPLLEHIKMVLPFVSVIFIILFTVTMKVATVGGFLLGLTAICAIQVFMQEYIEHRMHENS